MLWIKSGLPLLLTGDLFGDVKLLIATQLFCNALEVPVVMAGLFKVCEDGLFLGGMAQLFNAAFPEAASTDAPSRTAFFLATILGYSMFQGKEPGRAHKAPTFDVSLSANLSSPNIDEISWLKNFLRSSS